MARVGVNKAADQFVRADDVVAPGVGTTSAYRAMAEDVDNHDPPRPRSRPEVRRRTPTVLERLKSAEVELDRALNASYERFCAGEITAAEMKADQNRLIRDFNGRVALENIRYRSFLRSPRP